MLKFRPELIEPAPSGGWYVSDGDQAVGPVALELLVRGVETGRVPADAFIRHEAWTVWRPLHELTTEAPVAGAGPLDVVADGPLDGPADHLIADDEGPATIRESSPVGGLPIAPGVLVAMNDPGAEPTAADPAVAARERAAGVLAAIRREQTGAGGGFPPPLDLAATFDALAAAHGIDLYAPDDGAERSRPSQAPPRSSRGTPRRSSRGGATDDVASAARPAESSDRMDGDELAGATDLREALLLFLGAVVRRLDADGALLHRVDELGAAVACAHGRGAAEALGARSRLTDPSFLAASSGHVIIAEPDPGPGGSILRARLEAVCGAPIAAGGAGMFPIVAGGRLRAFVEVGRGRPMTMREWAEAERLVRSLVARIHAADW